MQGYHLRAQNLAHYLRVEPLRMNDLKDRLAFLRGDASREDFAKLVGVKPTTWRNYELGLTFPNSNIILRVCQEMNVSFAWLLTGAEQSNIEGTGTSAELAVRLAVSRLEVGKCTQCQCLEVELDRERTENRGLIAELRAMNVELRTVNAENRRLTQENKELTLLGVAPQERERLRRMRLHSRELPPSEEFDNSGMTP